MDKNQEEYAIEEAAGIAISLAFKREGYVNMYLLFWRWGRNKNNCEKCPHCIMLCILHWAGGI